jgi:hypothetical protein
MLPRPSGGVNYKETWGLDWLLDLLDTPITIFNYNLQSILLSLFQTVSLQFTAHTHTHTPGRLSLLSFISPLVPASNGGRPLSLVPELSTCHSHNDSCLSALAGTLKLPPLVAGNSPAFPTLLSGPLPINTELLIPRTQTHNLSEPTNWLYNFSADRRGSIARPTVAYCCPALARLSCCLATTASNSPTTAAHALPWKHVTISMKVI